MRTALGAAVMALGAVALSEPATAACRDGALGTHRTLALDPAAFKRVKGLEKGLGLRRKEVILTFDDGPLPGTTSRILKTLARDCVKASFFWVGKMARTYPALVRRAVREGHTVAHHTARHERLTGYSSAQAGRRIDRGIAQVEKVAYGRASTPPRVPFFRYPYLARSKRTDRLVRQRGLVVVGANVLSNDWRKHSPKRIHDRIMRQLRRDGRGIVLMHDIHARTARMLPMLLATLKREGWRIVHLVPPGAGTNPQPRIDAPPVVTASAGTLQPVDRLIKVSGADRSLPRRRPLSRRLATGRPVPPVLRPVSSADLARTGVDVALLLPVRSRASDRPGTDLAPGPPPPRKAGPADRTDRVIVASLAPDEAADVPKPVSRAAPPKARSGARAGRPKRRTLRRLPVSVKRAAAKPRRVGKRWRLRASQWIIN